MRNTWTLVNTTLPAVNAAAKLASEFKFCSDQLLSSFCWEKYGRKDREKVRQGAGGRRDWMQNTWMLDLSQQLCLLSMLL